MTSWCTLCAATSLQKLHLYSIQISYFLFLLLKCVCTRTEPAVIHLFLQGCLKSMSGYCFRAMKHQDAFPVLRIPIPLIQANSLAALRPIRNLHTCVISIMCLMPHMNFSIEKSTSERVDVMGMLLCIKFSIIELNTSTIQNNYFQEADFVQETLSRYAPKHLNLEARYAYL